MNADVVCLQEVIVLLGQPVRTLCSGLFYSIQVDLDNWKFDLLPSFRAAGYEGLWSDPPGRRPGFTVGCATLWRAARLNCIWAKPLPRALVAEFSFKEQGPVGDCEIGEGVVSAPSVVATNARAHDCARFFVAGVHLEGRRGAGVERALQVHCSYLFSAVDI
jgi:hypothetical protein